MAPVGEERIGDVSNVLFSNGWVARPDGTVLIYYASSDTRTHVATSSVERLLDYVLNTPEDGLRSAASVQARLELMTRLAREYRVDGLVLHSARSCKPYSVGQYDLKRLAGRDLDRPAVILEADIADPRAWSEEQAYARLEAFLETVEGR